VATAFMAFPPLGQPAFLELTKWPGGQTTEHLQSPTLFSSHTFRQLILAFLCVFAPLPEIH
jgi:hypothetical protein